MGDSSKYGFADGFMEGQGQPPVGVLTADSLRLYYGQMPPPNL